MLIQNSKTSDLQLRRNVLTSLFCPDHKLTQKWVDRIFQNKISLFNGLLQNTAIQYLISNCNNNIDTLKIQFLLAI